MAFKFNEYHLGGSGGSGGGDNTVIDVESLPTENVDDSKIYRVTENIEPHVDILLWESEEDGIMSLQQWETVVQETTTKYVYHLIDSLTDFDMNSMIAFGNDGDNHHLYIDKETGDVYANWRVPGNYMVDYLGEENCGIVSSYHEGEDRLPYTYTYCVVIGDGQRTIYGIPDKAENKEIFEYTYDGKWSASVGVVNVTELPAYGIKDDTVYRLSRAGGMYIRDTWYEEYQTLEELADSYGMTAELHIVESLPAQMKTIDVEGGFVPVYVVESTGIGYVSTTGNASDAQTLHESKPFPMLSDIPDMGIVESMEGIDQNGWYFIPPEKNISMHIHTADGWTNYIRSDAN